MNVFFPTIGTQLRLLDGWRFRAYGEYRNASLFWALGIQVSWRDLPYGDDCGRFDMYTLEPGTVLQVDRIYLRKGQEAFDSITFLIIDSPDERLLPWKKPSAKGTFANGAVRFWVRLGDANAIVGEFITGHPARVRRENSRLHETAYR